MGLDRVRPREDGSGWHSDRDLSVRCEESLAQA